MDASILEVEFKDGDIERLPEIMIADNILSQVDEEGHEQLVLDELLDQRTTSEASRKENGYIWIPRNDTRKYRKTTKG